MKNSLGDDYSVLKGFAYMLRSEKNAELMLLGFIEKNDFDFRAVRY